MWRHVLLALMGLAACGCIRTGPPAGDATPPKLVLTALNAVGRPTFASDEAGQPVDACAKFRSFPARFVLSVGDAGGVARAEVKVFPGRIPPDSVSVGPDAPESSWTITRTPDGASDVLSILLRRPGAGTVRTGVLAMFDAVPNDRPPFSVLASGWDYAGNGGHLYQVDARLTTGAPVVCR